MFLNSGGWSERERSARFQGETAVHFGTRFNHPILTPKTTVQEDVQLSCDPLSNDGDADVPFVVVVDQATGSNEGIAGSCPQGIMSESFQRKGRQSEKSAILRRCEGQPVDLCLGRGKFPNFPKTCERSVGERSVDFLTCLLDLENRAFVYGCVCVGKNSPRVFWGWIMKLSPQQEYETPRNKYRSWIHIAVTIC